MSVTAGARRPAGELDPGQPGARIELAAAALCAFMFSTAFLPKLLGSKVEGEEAVILRYLWIPVYALTLTGLALAFRRTLMAVLKSPFLPVLAALAIASSMWSIDPGMSMRRGVAVFCTTLFGIYLAVRFDWLTSLRLQASVWLFITVSSFFAGLLFPSWGRMQEIHVGAWSGVYEQKNDFGGQMARSAFLFAFLAWRDAAFRKWWVAGTVLATLLVGLSTSKTALLAAMLGFAILGFGWMMSRGRWTAILLVWFGAAAGLAGLMVVLVAPELIFQALGKDPTLTGRTDIWVELERAIAQRPWLGYGYVAFWSEYSEPRYWLQRAVDWPAPTGHNGWLDLAVSVGLVGAALYAADLAVTLLRALRRAFEAPVGLFALGAIAQFVLFAASESIILAPNTLIWSTWVFVSARLALDSLRPAQAATARPAFQPT